MRPIVNVFVELGRRLRRFGGDEQSLRAIDEAMCANEWFSRDDIMMAVNAICEEMLDEEKLVKWVAHYPMPATSKRVGIIMAGNLPLVGFFDLLCVLVCGHTAIIKPSSKDLVLMNYIVDLLRDICPAIPVEKYSETSCVDMIIATGGDAAAGYFQRRYADIPALIRGSRHSVAVLSGKEGDEEMQGLGRDIYSYSGLGCRNVSLIFVPKGWKGAIPRCDSALDMRRGTYLSDKALLTMTGVPFIDLGSALAIESRTLPERLCRLHYSYYDDVAEVERWLAENDERVQCVVSQCVQHPRRVDFSRAQYPTLWDYADGVDVMKFLTD